MPPGAELPPITLAPQNAPASYPALSREQVRRLLAGVELEKGDIRSARDQALERAKLSEAFARSLQAMLEQQQAAIARASIVHWIIGAACVAAGAAVGMVVGAVVEANKRPATSPAPMMVAP